jgi:exonuclease III
MFTPLAKPLNLLLPVLIYRNMLGPGVVPFEETLGVGTESTTRWTKILSNRVKSKKRQQGSKRPKAVVAKAKLNKVARRKQSQVAKKRLDGAQGVRIGEAKSPGPAVDSLRIATFNCQGGSGAWRFLNQASDDFDVACLQEVSFTSSQVKGYIKAARAKGFNFYFQVGCAGAKNQTVGGVGILARRNLPQRFGCQNGDEFAQTIFIWANGVFFGSLYAHPKEASPAQARFFFLDALARCAVQPSACWCVGGDFNETPLQSQMVEVARAVNGNCVRTNQPTRWVGSRELDFFSTNRPDLSSNVSSPSIKLSDHRIVSMTLDVPALAAKTASFQNGPRLNRPDHVDPDRWREALNTGWQSAAQEFDLSTEGVNQLSVQSHWGLLQAALRHTFRVAFASVSFGSRCQLKNLERKGSVAKVQWMSQAIRGPRPETGRIKERIQRRELARWYGLRRLLTKSTLSPAQNEEVRQLQHKLRLQERPSLGLVHRTIGALDLEFKKNERTARDAALKIWRQNMQNVQLLSARLKSKDAPATCTVATENEVAETVVEGARMIHQYWSQFWARLSDGRASVDGRCEALFHGIPQNSPYPWTAPTGLQLMATAQKAKGVGGTDGWTAAELKFLPLAAFGKVSEFFKKRFLMKSFPTSSNRPGWCVCRNPQKLTVFKFIPKIVDPSPS